MTDPDARTRPISFEARAMFRALEIQVNAEAVRQKRQATSNDTGDDAQRQQQQG